MNAPESKSESVSGEALHILKSLKENGRTGRSNKLADVKSSLELSVTQEFDTYFLFLRKFHYIAMDREAQVKLTDQGEALVKGTHLDRFEREVGQFFGEPAPGSSASAAAPEPAEDLLLADTPAHPQVFLEDQVNAQPPSNASLRRSKPDEPLAAAVAPSVAPVAPVAAVAPLASPASSPAHPRAEPAKGTDLDARYTRLDPLGEGPLGTVHKAKQNSLGLDVCVKELKDLFGYFSFLHRGEVQKRLRRELCAQAQVRHPAVVAVLDQNAEATRPYVVLELLHGSLREQLAKGEGKGVAPARAARWFLQLCYGLRAAHVQGLTHHNLKPENVLLDARGNAKLSDFGMARVVEVDASRGMPQVFVGTGGMSYLAPELLQKSREPGPPADVYGLGILLYEMLTGNIPGRRSPLPSEVNPEAPAKLDAIFDRMTQDRLEKRYPDFDAVLSDFYSAFSGGEYLENGDLILSSQKG